MGATSPQTSVAAPNSTRRALRQLRQAKPQPKKQRYCRFVPHGPALPARGRPLGSAVNTSSELQTGNRAVDGNVVEAAGGMHVKVRHVIEHAGGPSTAGKSDVQQLGATHTAEPERGTRVGSHAGNLDMAKLNIAHMTQIKMLRRQRTEVGRLGIVIRPFGWLQRSHFGGAATPVQEAAVADLDILYGMAGDAADDRGHAV